MSATIERLADVPGDQLILLIEESEHAGLGFVRRLAKEWAAGQNRFDRPGEALFAACRDGRLIGLCGLNVDPYAADPAVGRVRHLYVLGAHRRHGLGRRLVSAVISAARGSFATLRLRTSDPDAARLYEALGFRRSTTDGHCTHVMELHRSGSGEDRAST